MGRGRVALDDATAFVRLAQSVGDELREHGLAVDVLAFHPERVDAPLPGAVADDNDDATRHYAARSPYPTLQLLRTSDLRRARAEWAERGDGMIIVPCAATYAGRKRSEWERIAASEFRNRRGARLGRL